MKKNMALFVLGMSLLGLGAVLAAGSYLIAPNHGAVGNLPGDLVGDTVFISSASGATLRGWFVPGVWHDRAIVLLHSLHGSRQNMLERARFLHRAGYTVLLIDLQAHGESQGEAITFGYLERFDAIAAVTFVRQRLPQVRVGVIGTSLGGAAAVLAGEHLQADALVIESVYPTLQQAVGNRLAMRLGSWAALFTPVLTLQVQPRLGFSADDLQPINAIRHLQTPLLLIAGAADRHTTLRESQALAEAANAPKELWVIAGAAHVDFHAHECTAYERRVLRFFQQYLAASQVH